MKKFIFIIIILLIAYIIGAKIGSKVVYKEIEKQVILDNLTEKINELKGKLISDLKYCESNNVSEDTALITFDPHPTKKNVQVPSIGNLQFKVSTIQYYYQKFYSITLTNKEAVLVALDDKKAMELASDIIFKTDNGGSNWYNCAKKINLNSRLEVIRSLEK